MDNSNLTERAQSDVYLLVTDCKTIIPKRLVKVYVIWCWIYIKLENLKVFKLYRFQIQLALYGFEPRIVINFIYYTNP